MMIQRIYAGYRGSHLNDIQERSKDKLPMHRSTHRIKKHPHCTAKRYEQRKQQRRTKQKIRLHVREYFSNIGESAVKENKRKRKRPTA